MAADDLSAETGISGSQPELRTPDRRSVRPIVLLVLLLVTAGLFVATGFITRSFHALQDRLARQWYQRGETALSSNHAQAAVGDFRTALSYSRDDPQYRLRLAQALLAAHRTDEALAHFGSLWQDEPGNGDINLQLARIAVQQNDVQDALRYFHVAMYGAWEQNADLRRREARFELIDFLLARGQRMQAQAELTALTAGLPPTNVALRLKAADLFARAADFTSALDQYRQVLRLDPKDQQALAGAGRAAFELGGYEQAQRYLEAAVRENRQDSESVQLRDVVELVLRMDPYQRGLTTTERDRRAIAAFQQAGARLATCAQKQGEALAAAPSQTASGSALFDLHSRWTDLRGNVNARSLRHNPDLLQSALDLAFQIERETARVCGEPTGVDEALLLISHHREGSVH